MRVALPKQFGVEEVYPFLDALLMPDGSPRALEYEIDFSALGFIRPEGVVALANVLKFLLSKGCAIDFTGCAVDSNTPRTNPLRYLDDCLFFEHFQGNKLLTCSAPRPTTLPLTFLRTQNHYFWAMNTVVPWLDKQLGIDTQRQFPELPACLGELFNNIIDHAQVPIGAVHMQLFPSNHEVLIALADFGVGIPANIRKVQGLGTLSDTQALKKALEEGVSSRTTPRNRGAGLDTLMRNIIVHNKGRITIRSLKGCLAGLPAEAGMEVRLYETKQSYPGTLFLITLRTDTIPAPEDSEEAFAWD